jgi:3-dehydroquinate synthetase
MALLVDGRLGFNGSPAELIKQAEGFVYEIEATDEDLPLIQEKYAVISTIPSELGWKVEVVATDTEDDRSRTIDPNLEHAYVHFIEKHYTTEIKPDILDLDFKDD